MTDEQLLDELGMEVAHRLPPGCLFALIVFRVDSDAGAQFHTVSDVPPEDFEQFLDEAKGDRKNVEVIGSRGGN